MKDALTRPPRRGTRFVCVPGRLDDGVPPPADSGDVDDIRPLQFADSKDVDVGDLAVAIGDGVRSGAMRGDKQRSETPEGAATLANTIVDVYLEHQRGR